MKHKLQCRCGSLTGEVTEPREAVRGICYCKDCQAYANFLGRPDLDLDDLGGTDIVATQAKYVSFTGGTKSLACLSLTENGLLRWYAACCNTPIANTPRNHRVPYVGLVHSCLGPDSVSLDGAFGGVQMLLNTQSARRPPQSHPRGKFRAIVRFLPALLLGRLNGSYRHSAFFDTERGRPIVEPRVLTKAEWEQARRGV